MKMYIITILIFVFLGYNVFGQTKTYSGRVISEDLEILPEVKIYNSDTVILGKTDNDGRFIINLSSEENIILFRSSICCWEWKTIRVLENCNNLDVILMLDVIYDFMTEKRINRLRMKRFEKLANTHKEAFEKGIFVTEKPCYEQIFNLP